MRRAILCLTLLLGIPWLWQCSSKSGHPTGPIVPDTSGVKPPIVNPQDTGKGKPVVVDTIPKIDTVPKVDTVPKIDSVPKSPCGKSVCVDTIPPAGLDTAAMRTVADVLADSGIRLGLAYASQAGLSAERAPIWTSAGSDSVGYSYSLRQIGLFKRLFSHAQVRSGRFSIDSRKTVLAGQSLTLDDFPALGLTNPQGSMVLALSAEVSGPVLLSRGDVRRSTDYNIRYVGRTGTVSLWDTSSAAWKRLPMSFTEARKWNSEAAAELDRLSAGGHPVPDDSWDTTLVLLGAQALPAGLRRHSRIYVTGSLTLGTGVDLRDCQVISSDIHIEGEANIQGGVVFSTGIMTITGQPTLKSQFIARTTLNLAVQSRLQGYPVFYVEGRNEGYTHLGSLQVTQAQGEGIFLVDSGPGQANGGTPSLVFSPSTDLRGFAYTDSFMDPRGRFRGSLIGYNTRFELSGSIWIGHLGYADVGLAPIGLSLPFPGTRKSDEWRILTTWN